jgi:hypothetical protein
MRTISYTRNFKRDYRREKSGVLAKKLDALLTEAVNLLAADAAMPARYVATTSAPFCCEAGVEDVIPGLDRVLAHLIRDIVGLTDRQRDDR